MRRLFKEVGNRAYRAARVSGDRSSVSDDVRSEYVAALSFAESGIYGAVPMAYERLCKWWERRWLVRGSLIYVFLVLASAAVSVTSDSDWDTVLSLLVSVALGVTAGSGYLFRPDGKTIKLAHRRVSEARTRASDEDIHRLAESYQGLVDTYMQILLRKRGARRAFRAGLMCDSSSALGFICERAWGVTALSVNRDTLKIACGLANRATTIGELIEGLETLENSKP